jgi:hypothetical protein
MLWKFIVNVLSMLKSGFTGLRCLHFGEEAAVGLPIDNEIDLTTHMEGY